MSVSGPRFPARRRFSIGIPDVSGRNSGCLPPEPPAGRAPRHNSDFVSFSYRISDLASQNSYTKMPRSQNSDLVEPMEPVGPLKKLGTGGGGARAGGFLHSYVPTIPTILHIPTFLGTSVGFEFSCLPPFFSSRRFYLRT